MKFFRKMVSKYLAFLILGFVALMLMETGVLYYLDSYYFVDNTNYSVVKVVSGVPAAAVFKNVDIIFGNNPQTALQMVDQGKTRDEIGAETGLVLGVAGASLEITVKTFSRPRVVMVGLVAAGSIIGMPAVL